MNRSQLWAWYTGDSISRVRGPLAASPTEYAWKDVSGNGRSGVLNGTTLEVLFDQYGKQYVQGTSGDYAYLTRLPDQFTICSATFSGGGRVLALDSNPVGWYHGHSATGQDGVANYNGANKTAAPLPATSRGTWVWMCASNSPSSCAVAVNGATSCPAATAGGQGGAGLSINPGNLGFVTKAGQSNSWGVYEVRSETPLLYAL